MNYGDCEARTLANVSANRSGVATVANRKAPAELSGVGAEPEAEAAEAEEEAALASSDECQAGGERCYYGGYNNPLVTAGHRGEMIMKIRDSSSECSASSCVSSPSSSSFVSSSSAASGRASRPKRARAIHDSRRCAKGVGQLVLNVDFAPPQALHGDQAANDQANRPSKQENPPSGHLIELSLCMKQSQQSGRTDTNADEPANSAAAANQEAPSQQSTCDSDLAALREERCAFSSTMEALGEREDEQKEDEDKLAKQQEQQQKQRLVYERIDKISLRLAGLTFDLRDPASQPALTRRLPFKSGTFDACFCFNLFNVRAAPNKPAQVNSSECEQRDQQDQESWLAMERLTREIRLDLLAEVRRIVRHKGKILITVFAYECNQKHQKQRSADDDDKNRKLDPAERARGGRQRRPRGHDSSSGAAKKTTGEIDLADSDDEGDSCCPRCRLDSANERLQQRLQLQHQHQHQPLPRRARRFERRRRSSPEEGKEDPTGGFGDSRCENNDDSSRPSGRIGSTTLSMGFGNLFDGAKALRDDNSTTCDTIKQLIEQTQHQQQHLAQLKQQSADNQQADSTDRFSPGPKLSSLSRRYSLALWRVVGGSNGSGSGSISSLQEDLLANGAQHFQAHRDSLSEAAKRLGRRLSLGGTTLLGRLFAQTQAASQQQQQQQPDGQEEPCAQVKVNSVCDIELAGESEQLSLPEGRESCSEQRKIYLMPTDMMSLFQGNPSEFAQRHRQSIAVQTFFTKSIEVNADEEDEEASIGERCLLDLGAGNQQSEAIARGDSDADELTGDGDDYDDEDDDTTSGWTAPTTSATTTGLDSGSLAQVPDANAPTCGNTDSTGKQQAEIGSGGRIIGAGSVSAGSNSGQLDANQAEARCQLSGLAGDAAQLALAKARPHSAKSRSKSQSQSKSSSRSPAKCETSSNNNQAAGRVDNDDPDAKRCRSLSQLTEPYGGNRIAGSGKPTHSGANRLQLRASNGDDYNEEDAHYGQYPSLSGKHAEPDDIGSGAYNERQQQQQQQPNERLPSGKNNINLARRGRSGTESSSITSDAGDMATAGRSGSICGQTPGNMEHKFQPLDRINSDFSSFTLTTTTTTTTTTNDSDRNSKPTDTNSSYMTSSSSNRASETADLREDAGAQLAAGQRRAFSETEAYTAAPFAAEPNHLASGQAKEPQVRLPASVGQVSGSAAQCDATAPGEPNQRNLGANGLRGAEARQIRSAEPSLARHNSTAPTAPSTSTTSSGPNPNANKAPGYTGAREPVGRAADRQRARPFAAHHTTSTGSGSMSNYNNNIGYNVNHHHHSMTSLIGPAAMVPLAQHRQHYVGSGPILGQHAYLPLAGAAAGFDPAAGAPLASGACSTGDAHPSAGAGGQHAAAAGSSAPHSGYARDPYAYPANSVSGGNQQAAGAYHKQQWCHSNTFSSSLNSDISTSGGQTKDTTEKDSSRRTSTLSGISSIYQQEISLGLATPYSYGGSTPANSQANAACSNMGSIPELATSAGTDPDCAQPPEAASSDALAALKQRHGGTGGQHRHGLQLQSLDTDEPQQQPVPGEPVRGTLCVSDSKGDDQQAAEEAPNREEGEPESMAHSINLQRVAQSLRSQFKERLATMRSLNSFIALNAASSQLFDANQANPVIQEELPASANLVESADQPGNKAAHSEGAINEQQPTERPASALQSRAASKTDTPTPASIKSFFRSTSSAAFNAFASSFQYPSSSSTPTATTVIHQTNLSTSSQLQFNSGSLSSEVFDPPNSVGLLGNNLSAFAQPPGELAGARFAGQLKPSASMSESTQAVFSSSGAINSADQAANQSNAGLRSPLSPISVTSTRFFARIRDKFNLSPSLVGGTSSPTRPASSISNSTSTSLSALTVMSQQQVAHQSPPGKLLLAGSEPPVAKASLARPAKTDSSDSKVCQVRSTGETGPRAAEETNTTSQTTITTVGGDKAPLVDSCHDDHYQQVVSSRRPSFQRQLDEQVNQVYRMAVDRKLQSNLYNPVGGPHSKLATIISNEPVQPGSLESEPAAGHLERYAADTRRASSYVGSNLESIIRPMSSLMAQQSGAVIPHQHNAPGQPDSELSSAPSIYMPANYPLYRSTVNAVNAAPFEQVGFHAQKPSWMDSSQQSIDSSSSARSLRSCWFSMPELYAMNYDSSSQSPTDTHLFPANQQQQVSGMCSTTPTMDELLGALTSKLRPEQPASGKSGEGGWPQQQPAQAVAESWPSSQLYKQVTSDQGLNWSLSDLNLTSDDIAAPNLAPLAAAPAAATAQPQQKDKDKEAEPGAGIGSAVKLAGNNEAANKQAVELIKCSTLDDSVCVSMKSSSSKEDNPAASSSLKGDSKRQQQQQQSADGDGEAEDMLNLRLSQSRPESQNSTISNTSCALSDLNSSELRSPTGQHQWTTESSSPATPLNVSPLSTANGTGAPAASQQVEPAPAIGSIPRCLITSDGALEPAKQVAGAPDSLLSVGGGQKQRAMSLVPANYAHSNLESPSSPVSTCMRAYRSARGSIMPGVDVAPAATTLDLRLAAARRNRVKLTDLHPITFINDRKFLNSMSSLKKASDNKLNAIFNGPVGRRLSVSAEMHSQCEQANNRPNIKIGLAGYVYMNNSRRKPSDLSARANFRRPSLAPNFWLAPRRPSSTSQPLQEGSFPATEATFAGSPLGSGYLLGQAPDALARSRPRAASCAPGALLLATCPPGGAAEEPFKASQATGTRGDEAPTNTGQEERKLASELGELQKRALALLKQADSQLAPTTPLAPAAAYQIDKRRSTIALLDRLSESSVEQVETESGFGNASFDQFTHNAPDQSRIGHRKSVSCLLKIGEEEEFGLGFNPGEFNSVKKDKGESCGELLTPVSTNTGDKFNSTSLLSANEIGQKGAVNRDANDCNNSDSSRSASSSSSSRGNAGNRPTKRPQKRTNERESDSSSDDGDLERLLARYPDESVPPANDKGHRLAFGRNGHGADIRRHNRSQSICPSDSSSERVVKNDMILKQLLQATNAASINDAAGRSAWRTGHNKQDSVRRFSAINLYQRDEDVFVANSMKRPPSSHMQVLSTLPLLAGTLPVIGISGNNTANTTMRHSKNAHNSAEAAAWNFNPSLSGGQVEERNQAHRAMCTQLPVIVGHRAGVKSIVTGNSGFGSLQSSTGHFRRAQEPSPSQQQYPTKTSSISNSMAVAQVDIEEQLNRLRQQEKRTFCSPSSSSPRDYHFDDCADDPLASYASGFQRAINSDESDPLEAILEQANESASSARLIKGQAVETGALVAQSRPTVTATCNNNPPPPVTTKLLLLSPIKSPPSSPSSPPGSLMLAGAGRVNQQDYSAGKSCEPFKQLDTIMEGRGLLLGAEQQADPSYANRLRRLSGNHSRRSSVQSAGGQSRPVSGELDDTWCRCHLSSPSNEPGESSERRRRRQAPGGRHREQATPPPLSGQPAAAPTTAGSSISSSSKFVLDTMKSLARRTLNNLSTIGGSNSKLAAPAKPALVSGASNHNQRQISVQASVENSGENTLEFKQQQQSRRQQRSSSMVAGSSSFAASWTSAGGSGAPGSGRLQQSTLPSQLLRDKVRVDRVARASRRAGHKVKNKREDYVEADEMELDECRYSSGSPSLSSSSSTSSVTGSADDSSLMSLDDAEKYRTQNKDNKMKHGRSLSSSSLSSSSTLSPTRPDAEKLEVETVELKVGKMANSNRKQTSNKLAELSDEEEQEVVAEDEEEDDEEFGTPKVCFKCNKRIRMETEEDFYNDEEDEEEDFVDEEEEEEGEGLNVRATDESANKRCNSANATASQLDHQPPADSIHPGGRLHKNASQPVGRSHHSRRRNAAARRSASMNSAEPELAGQAAGAGPHYNRRKNKWHIQRNLAPKLKRQRSFSANYAPEVPNPVMPPPRRFSAAPTLSCPHRNKSSSHSSSSLHHTYSIDSSESMITVIPANRNQDPKRASRGSLSCISAQGGGIEASGSFYTLPKSPVSPRSPGRCSPGLLTPNTSEAATLLEPPFSPATTTNTTCSSAATNTVIHHQQQQQQHPQPLIGGSMRRTNEPGEDCNATIFKQTLEQAHIAGPSSPSYYNLTLPSDRRSRNPSVSGCGEDENLSLAVENGTSYNSSRLELDGFESEAADGFQTEAEDDDDNDIDKLDDYVIEPINDTLINQQPSSNDGNQRTTTTINANQNPDRPIICETINDFCARHSREELEYLIGRVGFLKICDCYFSERSLTLCMVIEVKEK